MLYVMYDKLNRTTDFQTLNIQVEFSVMFKGWLCRSKMVGINTKSCLYDMIGQKEHIM